jgi:hypothetical protein
MRCAHFPFILDNIRGKGIPVRFAGERWWRPIVEQSHFTPAFLLPIRGLSTATSPLGERNHPVVTAVAILACHAVRNDPLLTDDVSGKRETFVRVHVLLIETLTATT